MFVLLSNISKLSNIMDCTCLSLSIVLPDIHKTHSTTLCSDTLSIALQTKSPRNNRSKTFQGSNFCCIPNLKSLVFEIWRSKRIGVTSLTFQGHVTSSVTTSRDYSIARMPFPIGSPLEPNLYL